MLLNDGKGLGRPSVTKSFAATNARRIFFAHDCAESIDTTEPSGVVRL
jgi:hypothetical protein